MSGISSCCFSEVRIKGSFYQSGTDFFSRCRVSSGVERNKSLKVEFASQYEIGGTSYYRKKYDCWN